MYKSQGNILFNHSVRPKVYLPGGNGFTLFTIYCGTFYSIPGKLSSAPALRTS